MTGMHSGILILIPFFLYFSGFKLFLCHDDGKFAARIEPIGRNSKAAKAYGGKATIAEPTKQTTT